MQNDSKPNYHVFFTTQYTAECFQHCCFGATSVNSLANVKEGDIAFLFDGLRWNIYGPLRITSPAQYHDDNPIYGTSERSCGKERKVVQIVKYTNRVSFDTSDAREMSINKLFVQESNPTAASYLLNRTILSVIIANKQVHATPLTNSEGDYLFTTLMQFGVNAGQSNYKHIPANNTLSIIDHIINNRKPSSEAVFELLLIAKRYNGKVPALENKLFNQFILGIQRQIDILSVGQDSIAIIELKKKDNQSNPYQQLREYSDYAISDYRMKEFDIKKIQLIAILEEGNIFLDDNKRDKTADISVYKFNLEKTYILNIKAI